MKQVDISRFENGRKEPPPEVEAAFKAHWDRLKALDAPVSILRPDPAASTTGEAGKVLLELMATAWQELGHPMSPEEAEALSRAKPEELLSESVLTREALEVQASRELLSGAKAFRAKREAARSPSGRKGV